MSIPRLRFKNVPHFRRVKLCGPDAYPLHDHEFGEIFWLDEGCFRHCVNGRSFSLEAGTLVFIRPWDAHSFHGASDHPFYIHNVCFDWRTFLYLQQRYFPHQTAIYGENEPFPKMVLFNERQLKKAHRLFLELFTNRNERLNIEWYLLSLFTEFCPIRRDAAKTPPDLPPWMAAAWEQIHEPEHFRLGVQEFCRLSGRSREHVSQEFRKATGQTAAQYIHQLRMNHAAVLLEASSREIVDISLECGFESLSHFYANFRKLYKTSPRVFRQRAQGKMYTD
ncbi:MAG TPA: AraC family transcriptional regulator [Chthoniobacteraceae bacterium]|nr:AraC family transcriptional regulator [Chthoniobacteraceae bacterium]